MFEGVNVLVREGREWLEAHRQPSGMRPYADIVKDALLVVEDECVHTLERRTIKWRRALIERVVSQAEMTGLFSVPRLTDQSVPAVQNPYRRFTDGFASYTKHVDGSIAYLGCFNRDMLMHGQGAFFLPGQAATLQQARGMHPAVTGTWYEGRPHGPMRVYYHLHTDNTTSAASASASVSTSGNRGQAALPSPFSTALEVGAAIYANGQRTTDRSGVNARTCPLVTLTLAGAPWLNHGREWDVRGEGSGCVVQ